MCFAALAAILLSGCGAPHGQPQQGFGSPSAESKFWNLALCTPKTARAVTARTDVEARRSRSPIQFISPSPTTASIRKVIANGVRGTAMPAFAESAGGMLTDKQIDVITNKFARVGASREFSMRANPPSYAAKSAGDPQRGQAAYKTYCESCHGPDGRGGPKGSAITDDSFLALVSDQGLRTIVIAGRPELGAPDWRGNVPRQTDVRPGSHRRCCVARLTPRPNPGSTLFRRELHAAPGA